MSTTFSTNSEHDLIVGETDIFPINWLPRLKGDTITGSTWTAPTGITLGALSFNSTSTQAFITGDTVLITGYCIENVVTTLGGKTLKGIITMNVLADCST